MNMRGVAAFTLTAFIALVPCTAGSLAHAEGTNFTISGTVLDKSTKQPLAGATVTLMNTIGNRPTGDDCAFERKTTMPPTTDANGEFLVEATLNATGPDATGLSDCRISFTFTPIYNHESLGKFVVEDKRIPSDGIVRVSANGIAVESSSDADPSATESASPVHDSSQALSPTPSAPFDPKPLLTAATLLAGAALFGAVIASVLGSLR